MSVPRFLWIVVGAVGFVATGVEIAISAITSDMRLAPISTITAIVFATVSSILFVFRRPKSRSVDR